MRILFTLAHFYNPDGGGQHASKRKDPTPRIAALESCVSSLHQLFSRSQHVLEIARCVSFPANGVNACEIDVVICTTQGKHVLDTLSLKPGSFTHHATNAEPMYLGYECQAVMRDHLGKYDYYCFLEDDLILHDPWFFLKLAWFSKHVGEDSLLQPNRYEQSHKDAVYKLYIDGEINPGATARYQNVQDRPRLTGSIMGYPVTFQRTTNPHSGCYFLTQKQLEHWTKQPYFLDREKAFVSPLESAASLGVMRAFRVYKPAPENAGFLEIQHWGNEFLAGNRVGNKSGKKPVIGGVG